MGQTKIALAVCALFSLTIFIFSHPKFLLARFLYPGIITFFFLMVIPIVSTIVISATNLSTGHFMGPQKAMSLILDERYLDEQAPVLDFMISKDPALKTLVLISGNFQASLEAAGENQTLTFVPKDETQKLNLLSKKEVLDFFLENPNLKFSHPLYQETSFSFFRTDKLASLVPRYEKLSSTSFQDVRTKTVYEKDPQLGKFISESGDELTPGFVTWVGLKNYLILIQNKDLRSSFLKVFSWTLVWGFFSVFLSFSLGITLAIILNDKNLKLKGLYRGLLILPYSIPFFISVLIFKGMLNQDFGLINQLLGSLSIEPIPWLHDGLWAKVACLIVNLWLGFPYMFLVTTGILQSIPESLYEAAKLDGANGWQRFRSLTLPLVMSAVGPLLVGSFAFNINNFVGIYLLTGGGPAMEGAKTQVGQTDILISYTYRLAFEGGQGQNFGLASSIAVIIFFIVAALTMVNFKLFSPKENHG